MAKALVALIVSVFIAFSAAAAQPKSATKKPAKPAWTELTPAQQQVLMPLQNDWEQLDTTRRKKWVSIADRYPTMKPAQQERLQKRMREWAALSPDERRTARQKYQSLKKAPPQKRDEVRRRWREYEQSQAPAEAPPAPVSTESTPGD